MTDSESTKRFDGRKVRVANPDPDSLNENHRGVVGIAHLIGITPSDPTAPRHEEFATYQIDGVGVTVTFRDRELEFAE